MAKNHQLPLKINNMSPKKYHFKRKIVFQPCIFQGIFVSLWGEVSFARASIPGHMIGIQLPSYTVDGKDILHQLRLVGYPIIYQVLYIPGGCLGCLPSTVAMGFSRCFASKTHDFKCLSSRFFRYLLPLHPQGTALVKIVKLGSSQLCGRCTK